MTTLKSLLLILMSVLLVSCKKTEADIEQAPIFNFVYNGKLYKALEGITTSSTTGVSRNRFGAPAIIIGQPDLFGGYVYFEAGKCAYLEPQYTTVLVNDDCIITSRNVYGQNEPIDSVKVFLYQSGSMDVKFYNISTRTVTQKDWFLGTDITITYTTCSAKGTFDLTLVNKNNEIIKITDGVIDIKNIQFQD